MARTPSRLSRHHCSSGPRRPHGKIDVKRKIVLREKQLEADRDIVVLCLTYRIEQAHTTTLLLQSQCLHVTDHQLARFRREFGEEKRYGAMGWLSKYLEPSATCPAALFHRQCAARETYWFPERHVALRCDN